MCSCLVSVHARQLCVWGGGRTAARWSADASLCSSLGTGCTSGLSHAARGSPVRGWACPPPAHASEYMSSCWSNSAAASDLDRAVLHAACCHRYDIRHRQAQGTLASGPPLATLTGPNHAMASMRCSGQIEQGLLMHVYGSISCNT